MVQIDLEKEDFMVKICDFGLLRSCQDDFEEPDRFPMIHEIIFRKDYKYKTDVYGIGLIFF